MAQIHSLAISLTDPYYTAIGAIAMRWAALEYILQNIIWRAMKLDNKQGRVLTIGMNTQPLTGIIRNPPRRWVTDEKIKADIKSLLEDIDTWVEWRNSIVHGVWTSDPTKPTEAPWLNYMKKGHERLLPSAEQVTPAYMDHIAEAISTLNERALAILNSVGGVQPPSQETE